MSENNLPAKYRYYATQAAIRAGDYLGTRANPEMLPPRSMRRLMEGETMPNKIYMVMKPAIPFGIECYTKQFKRNKEELKARGPGRYCGYCERTQTHVVYIEKDPRTHKRATLQMTPHVTFDLTVPVSMHNAPAMIVGSNDEEVQPRMNTRARKYEGEEPVEGEYAVDSKIISESTMLELAGHAQSGTVNGKTTSTNEKTSEVTDTADPVQSGGEDDEQEHGENTDGENQNTGDGDVQVQHETYECEDNDQGEVTMTHPHVENEMQGFTVAMLRSKAKIGRILKERAHGNTHGAKVNAVIGDVFKNYGDAHAWVINIGNDEERKRKMCMLRDGRLKEFNKMEDGGVLEAITEDLIPRDHIEKGWVLNSTGQYHQKGDKDNNVSEFKHRWVVDGSAAIKGVHYAQNSSPTPKPESIRIICAEAAIAMKPGDTDAGLRQGDIPSAYTHWDQPEEYPYYIRMPRADAIYIKKNIDGVEQNVALHFKVNKCLYGSPGAGYTHYKNMRMWLEEKGFVTGEQDEATWTHGVAWQTTRDAYEKKVAEKGQPALFARRGELRMVIWVDDILYHCRDEAKREQVEGEFNEEFGSCGWHDADFFAGLNIEITCAKDTQDEGKWGVKMTGTTSLELTHEKHNDQGLIRPKQRHTPAPDGWTANKLDMDKKEGKHTEEFVRATGALGYVAQNVRLDCAFVMGQHARIQKRASKEQHATLIERTLEYMYQTRKRGIMYKPGNYTIKVGHAEKTSVPATEMVAFTDSSHSDVQGRSGQIICPCSECYKKHKIDWGENDSLCTTIAHVFMYAGAPISWRSATSGRHHSSTASELDASCEGTKRHTVIKKILKQFGRYQGRTKFYIDNAACAFICVKEFATKRCGHIIRKMFMARTAHHTEEDDDRAIEVLDIATECDAADIGTKSLPRKTHMCHVYELMHDEGQDEEIATQAREELIVAVEALRKTKCMERKAACTKGKAAKNTKKVTTITTTADENKWSKAAFMAIVNEFQQLVKTATEKQYKDGGCQLKSNISRKIRVFKAKYKKENEVKK